MDKLTNNVSVLLVITSDDTNFSSAGLDFREFIQKGGKLYAQDNDFLMHHKFCIIDSSILINGSYNWTLHAENSNIENVLVFEDDEELINIFNNEFNTIIRSDKVLVNAIPTFDIKATAPKPILVNIEVIDNENKYNNDSGKEENLIRVYQIGRIRSINGSNFIPVILYKKNGIARISALYFAWEDEYDLNRIRTLKPDDIFFVEEGALIRDEEVVKELIFPLYSQISWEMKCYWTTNKINDAHVFISVLRRKGQTKAESLMNLCYDNYITRDKDDLIDNLFKIGRRNFEVNKNDIARTYFLRILELQPDHEEAKKFINYINFEK
jgi:hypothetical protein